MLDVRCDGRVFFNGEELEQHYSTKGMKVVIDDKEHYVHKLVAEKFLEDYKPFYKVVHINGNITDNRVENLKIQIPLDFLEVLESSKRPITLQHKKNGTIHKFDSLREASVFMGYKEEYLAQWFYTSGKEELSWFHDYTIVKIGPKDARVINRGGKTIFLRNKYTGEVHYFLSLSQASKFLGRNPHYIKMRLKRGVGLPIDCDYEILEIKG